MIRVQAILITGLFAFMLFKPAIPYIDYMVRKSYIIEKFCINKDTPDMGCNGKCHLKKELSKTEAGGEKDPVPVQQKQWKMPEFLVCSSIINKFLPDFIRKRILYINNYSFQFAASVFHPPV